MTTPSETLQAAADMVQAGADYAVLALARAILNVAQEDS